MYIYIHIFVLLSRSVVVVFIHDVVIDGEKKVVCVCIHLYMAPDVTVNHCRTATEVRVLTEIIITPCPPPKHTRSLVGSSEKSVIYSMSVERRVGR